MSEKISIIIPFHNTPMELFGACIDSILSSTYHNFEIIVVDDGSDAEHSEKLDKICAENNQIQVFHIEKKGVSYARNFGTEKATGEWITYVDSDDQIAPFFLEHALRAAKETEAEFIVGYVTHNVKDLKNTGSGEIVRLSSAEIARYRKHMMDRADKFFLKDRKVGINRGPHARLIKGSIARETRFFNSLAIGEDSIWNINVLQSVPALAIVRETWYSYTNNNKSVTHRFDPDMLGKLQYSMYAFEKQVISAYPELELHYENRMCDEFCGLIVKNFLLNPDNPMRYMQKKRYIRNTLREEPFDRLKKCKMYPNKFGVKELLLRTNLILEAYWLKELVE